MPLFPAMLLWSAGAAGAAIAARFLLKEWHRINAELERARNAPTPKADRSSMQTLRRDPASGHYTT